MIPKDRRPTFTIYHQYHKWDVDDITPGPLVCSKCGLEFFKRGPCTLNFETEEELVHYKMVHL